ncbi:SDR family NAD(P)-dependent oxidoreductase [Janibacter terrae]|uniref:SDR family NAD(P)-dependent oxidoreductase n=1 Tax=Janibacter terrae TaxID=103817 RepID=UPI000A73C1A1|nr:SDR family oxidoreductase [Janibacter terrae]
MSEHSEPTGQVALITGGARGFGAAFAASFAADGVAVVLVDLDGAAAEETAAGLRAQGARALAIEADVTDEIGMSAAVARTVDTFGSLDLLVNNAGLHLVRYNRPFAELGVDELRRLLDVNVVGLVVTTLAAREAMRVAGGGCVVNISSIAGYLSKTPYGVSKLAVRGVTVALANDLAADQIRVNAVAPGLMGTESALAGLPTAMVEDFVSNLQLVHRLGEQDDVVAAVRYLCSPAASFITGETIKVSGGYPLGLM